MVNIINDSRIALLNELVEGLLDTTRLIYFFYLAVNIAISTAWKKPLVDLEVMKCKLTWIMTNEKLVSVLQDTSPQFERVWNPWIQ